MLNASPGMSKRRTRCKFRAPKDGYKQTILDDYFQVRCRASANKVNMSSEQISVLETLKSQVSFVNYGTVHIYSRSRDSDNSYSRSRDSDDLHPRSRDSDDLMNQCAEEFDRRAQVFSSASYFPTSLVSSIPLEPVAKRNLQNAVSNHVNSEGGKALGKRPIQVHSNVVIKPKTLSSILNEQQNTIDGGKKRKLSVESPQKKVPNQPLENDQLKVKNGKKLNMVPVNLMCTVVTEATKQYKHVFQDEELEKLKHFCEFKESYKYFIFKLFMYLPTYYNIYSFCERISVGLDAVEVRELSFFFKTNQFIVIMDYAKERLSDLLDLVPRKDLRVLCESFKLFKVSKSNKDVMKGALLGMAETQRTLSPGMSSSDVLRKEIKIKLGDYIQLNPEFRKLLSYTYFLYTFTNSDFIIKEDFFYRMLDEKVVFPSNTVLEPFIKVFNTRHDFLSYAKAREVRTRLEVIRKVKKSENYGEVFKIAETSLSALKSLVRMNDEEDNVTLDNQYRHLTYYTAKSQYVSILNISVEYLKSQYSNFVRDCLVYLLKFPEYKHYFGNWYSQLALVLERHCSKHNQAAEILIKGLRNKNDLCEIDLEEIAVRARRLSNSSRVSRGYRDALIRYLPQPPDKQSFPTSRVTAKPIRSNIRGQKRHYLMSNENGNKEFTTVEEVALNYYKLNGYPKGKHCEGTLMCSIFCLLFWDIIYEKHVPGAFISKIQSHPLDFMTTYFYSNRSEEIDERLKQIVDWSDEVLVEFITLKFNNHSHETSICNISEDLSTLLDVVTCIGREVLSKIFERLVKRFRQYRSGMPDLLVWNSHDKKCKFVEVKGEGDKLSTKQKFWLQYLRSIGAEIEVCQVQAVGYYETAKKTKQK